MRSIAGILGFLVFVILVVVFIVGSGTKIGNTFDPCQRATAQGVANTIPGCK